MHKTLLRVKSVWVIVVFIKNVTGATWRHPVCLLYERNNCIYYVSDESGATQTKPLSTINGLMVILAIVVGNHCIPLKLMALCTSSDVSGFSQMCPNYSASTTPLDELLGIWLDENTPKTSFYIARKLYE